MLHKWLILNISIYSYMWQFSNVICDFLPSIQVHVIKTASFILYTPCDAAQLQSSHLCAGGRTDRGMEASSPCLWRSLRDWDTPTIFFFLKVFLKNFNSSTSGVICMYASASWCLGGWLHWRIRLCCGKLSNCNRKLLKQHPFSWQTSAVSAENTVRYVVLSWNRGSARWSKMIWFQRAKKKSRRSVWFQCFIINS